MTEQKLVIITKCMYHHVEDICDAKVQRTDFTLTVELFLNLEGDRLSGHLQQVDGFAQGFSF